MVSALLERGVVGRSEDSPIDLFDQFAILFALSGDILPDRVVAKGSPGFFTSLAAGIGKNVDKSILRALLLVGWSPESDDLHSVLPE